MHVSKATYQISESTYAASATLVRRFDTKKRRMLFLMVVLIAVTLWLSRDHVEWARLALVWFGLMGIYLLANIFYLAPKAARRKYQEFLSIRAEIEIEITPELFRLTSQSGTAKHEWCEISKWRCSELMYLLFVAPGVWQIIPRGIDDFDYGFLDQMLQENVGFPEVSTL